MFTRNGYVRAGFVALGLTLAASAANAQSKFGIGKAASDAEIKAWDIDVSPNGAGLPAGSGSVQQGMAVYTAKCAACHGEKGTGKPADALAGGKGTLAAADVVRTVGSYWPYATTLFDYVRRAMPVNAPMSLTNDEVYEIGRAHV